jgi:nitroreductase
MISGLGELTWNGCPNVLSPDHVDWNLDRVAAATVKPRTDISYEPFHSPFPALTWEPSPVHLRRIIRQRRSAVAMDAHTGLSRAAFYQMLLKTLPGPGQVPFTTLPWRPQVHLFLFVHRVQGLDPGFYLLVRDPAQLDALRTALDHSFAWERPEGCPDGMPLFRLVTGDARRGAAQVSCGQDIAADGCFSVAMLAEFAAPLRRHGPWFYPRLFWECGLLGQMLYLEAEASGVRATGIGCYFDNPVHELLGLKDLAYQDLYHFTVGGAVEDGRLSTLPAYPESDTGS